MSLNSWSRDFWRIVIRGGMMAMALGWLPGARAHDPGLSSLEIRAQADGVKLELRLSARDLALAVPESDLDGDGVVRADEVSMSLAQLRSAMDGWIGVEWVNETGSEAFVLQSTRVSWNPEDEDIAWEGRIEGRPTGLWRVASAEFEVLPPGHRQFATAQTETGATVAEALLSGGRRVLAVDWGRGAAAEPAAPANAQSATPGSRVGLFFKLGVEHILIGFDHLLFLGGLLVGCRSWKAMMGVITSFTVAHSITLGLAALDIVQFPGAWVEPLIAASIVYVGIENLVRPDQVTTGRWKLTFAFGLIHGFGFAGVLRELGIGGDGGGVVSALFGFNLGVEIGQFAIALLVLPVLAKARTWPRFEKKGPMILSLFVAAMGLFWLVQRTLF